MKRGVDMTIFRKIGSFFKTAFCGAYRWTTVYFALITFLLSVGAFYLIVRFGNIWHLSVLIVVLIVYIICWKRQGI